MSLFRWLWRRAKVSREGRLAYSELRDAATPSRGYFIMTALSALIAAFGLFLDSVAVIVGAMLIAPLMSPVLATGLAVARGDGSFLRGSLRAVVQGAVVAVLCAAAVSLVSPQLGFGSEILSRTRPTLLDLAVAFASGVAGAYTFSSKDLSAALPGVAIAAALIPPLAVVGIGAGLGRHDILLGSLLLFVANLVAIAFGGALTFIALGFFPKARGAAGERRLRGLLAASVLLALVAVPMAYFTITNVTKSRRGRSVAAVVENNLPRGEGYYIGATDWVYRGGRYDVTALVYGGRAPTEDRLGFIQNELASSLGKETKFHVYYVPYENVGPK